MPSGQKETLQGWNYWVSVLMDNLETSDLPHLLCQALKSVVDFEHSAIFAYPEGRRPVFLHDGFSAEIKRSLVTPYLNGTYLVDPFFAAVQARIEPGLYRMQDLAPDEFYPSVGAHPGYVSPCISEEPGYLSEEIGFFAVNGDGPYLVLSLMRGRHRPPFSQTEFRALHAVTPIVLSTMARHWRDLGETSQSRNAPLCMSSVIEQAFTHFGSDLLTPREQEVVQMILRGHSTQSIARITDILESTVKSHRKNAYAKLGISSQGELFSLFIDLLATARHNEAAAEGP